MVSLSSPTGARVSAPDIRRCPPLEFGRRDRPLSPGGLRVGVVQPPPREYSWADLARPSCRSCSAKMSGEENPASKPTPVQDVQGDGRWMSLVSDPASDTQESGRGPKRAAGSCRFLCVIGKQGSCGAAYGSGAGRDHERSVLLIPPCMSPKHHRFVADSKDKEPEVVFIGDSLVQLMHQCEIWRELFSPLHALNFGIGSDSTQHVLWRLENGELEHIRPKIVVVWVGTNNHGHTAEQVTGGIEAIVQLVNQRQPQARVVVLGLLPRGQHPNPLREKNQRVNELVRSALAGHPRAHFLDADPGFVHSDGTISHHDMYDYLHLSRLGYTPVCRALHSLLLRLLAQDEGQGVPQPTTTP
ncbi:hypothetical protein MC885_021134 [Smutsia gigantea]|nr:hypothetical protein MC885_021134 [Smutsia gigantea]